MQRNKISAHYKKKPRKAAPRQNAYIDYETENRARAKSRSRLGNYLHHHVWVARSALQQLLQSPLSSFLTAAVIAIALALPTGLFTFLQDVKSVVGHWQHAAQASLFIKQDVSRDAILALQSRLQAWPEINTVAFVSSEQALAEFKQQSGFGAAMDILESNPLPSVLVLTFDTNTLQSGALHEIFNALKTLPEVDIAQLDFEWLQRLNAVLSIGQRAIYLLAVLLGVAVLLVIGNTIRLTIHNRRQEIVVTKLIGATNQFIRRPFLYTGIWYGLFGAMLAWMLVDGLMWSLGGPVQILAQLYNSAFKLSGLTLYEAGTIIAAGVSLGWLGSWMAVARHLHQIEPR